MLIDEVLQHYGSAIKATHAIGYKRASFSLWIRRGFIAIGAQKLFEKQSKGLLKADIEHTTSSANIKPHNSDEFNIAYRYWDDVHGMCRVTSMNFRHDGTVKIFYAVPDSFNEKRTTFETGKLTQAIDYIDKDSNRVYVGDILQLKDRRKIKILGMGAKLLDLLDMNEGYKVVGNIYEGK